MIPNYERIALAVLRHGQRKRVVCFRTVRILGMWTLSFWEDQIGILLLAGFEHGHHYYKEWPGGFAELDREQGG